MSKRDGKNRHISRVSAGRSGAEGGTGITANRIRRAKRLTGSGVLRRSASFNGPSGFGITSLADLGSPKRAAAADHLPEKFRSVKGDPIEPASKC